MFDFYKDHYAADGYKNWCVDCDLAASAERYKKKKILMTPEQKMKRKESYYKWKLNNQEAYKESQRMYRLKRKSQEDIEDS